MTDPRNFVDWVCDPARTNDELFTGELLIEQRRHEVDWRDARLFAALRSLCQIFFERAILQFSASRLQQRQKDFAPVLDRGENACNLQIVAVRSIINLELVRTVAAFDQQSRGFLAAHFSMIDPRDWIAVPMFPSAF